MIKTFSYSHNLNYMFNHYILNKTIIFTFLFITLFLGFFLNENSSGGAITDFQMRLEIINSFNDDFLKTFLNYNQYPDRHSPLILILITILLKFGFDLNSIRFLHLFIVPLIVFVTYKCLISKYGKKCSNIFFLISGAIFFLSPTIRSISIWPDSRLLGLLIFLISLFFFLEFNNKPKFKYAIYNTLSLILASYVSPNFSIFFLYFFYIFFKHYSFSKKTFKILFLNLFFSLPMIFYLFIIDVNFLEITAVPDVSTINRINPSNKILIVSSLILFYSFPLFLNRSVIKSCRNLILINKFIILSLSFFILASFFNYSINYTGGGIFFKFSYLIFENEYFFLLISFISFLYVAFFFKLNFNNLLLFLILILSNPQLTIYHKYYDPLLIILFLTLFEYNFNTKKILNITTVFNLYLFYSIFLIINLFRFAF